jgi:hypothetical protein
MDLVIRVFCGRSTRQNCIGSRIIITGFVVILKSGVQVPYPQPLVGTWDIEPDPLVLFIVTLTNDWEGGVNVDIRII